MCKNTFAKREGSFIFIFYCYYWNSAIDFNNLDVESKGE